MALTEQEVLDRIAAQRANMGRTFGVRPDPQDVPTSRPTRPGIENVPAIPGQPDGPLVENVPQRTGGQADGPLVENVFNEAGPMTGGQPAPETAEQYEESLPRPIRDSRQQRRSRGFDVPDRPVPSHVRDVWRAAGDGIDQATIQWGYDQRNRQEQGLPSNIPQDNPVRPGQSELWSTREEYEALLPAPVRDSMNQRRTNGHVVPFRPVPDNVLRAWMAAGDDADPALIQWGYMQRDRGSNASASGALPGTSANPYPGPYRPGYRPGVDGLEGLAQRDTPDQDIAAVGYDIGERARQLLAERNARLAGRSAPAGQQAAAAPALDPDNPDNDYRTLPEGDIDEATAQERNRRYRTDSIRGGEMHPQQELDLGSAEEQNQWTNYVRGSVDRMNRYYPGSLGPVKIEGPSWREREASGAITPEQADKYRAAELRQRERSIIRNYGNAISDETAARLSAAVDAGDLDTVKEIHDSARRNNRLSRERNYDAMQQNQRVVGALNNPNERAGFVYRTMASGTPEERSALAATLGDDMVYPVEMAASMPAAEAGGGGPQGDSEPGFSDLSRQTFTGVRNMVLEGNLGMAQNTLLTYYADMYPDMPPAEHSRMAEDHLTDLMFKMTYSQEQPARNFATEPRLQYALRQRAQQGWDAYQQWAYSVGMNEAQVRQTYKDATGQDPDGNSGWSLWDYLPSVDALGAGGGAV